MTTSVLDILLEALVGILMYECVNSIATSGLWNRLDGISHSQSIFSSSMCVI